MAVDNIQDRITLIEDELSALSGKSERSMQAINGLITEAKAQHLIRRVVDQAESNAQRLRAELNRRLTGLGNVITSDNLSEYLIDLTQSEGAERNTTYFSAKGSVDYVLDTDNSICEISWDDIEVVAYDGQRFTFSASNYTVDLFEPDRVFYFLGNRNEQTIEVVNQQQYEDDSAIYGNASDYILFWSVTFESEDNDDTFNIKFDYPAFASALFRSSDEDINAFVEGFKIQSLGILGQDYDSEVDLISLDPEHPLRIDMPVGTRIEIGSTNAIVRSFTPSGAVEIPIIEQRIEQNKGALIRFNLDYLQAQLQAQPDRIRAYVQSVDQTTQAQLELIQDNQSAIASISTSLQANNINATGSFLQMVERIDNDLGSLTTSSTDIENIIQANNFTLTSNISSRVAAAEADAEQALTSTISLTNALSGQGFGTIAEFVSRVTQNQAEILNRVSNDVSGAEAMFQLMANEMNSTAKLKASNINIEGVVNFINDGTVSTRITKDGIDTVSIASDAAFLSQLAAENITLTGSISGNYDAAQNRGWLIDGVGNAIFNEVTVRGAIIAGEGSSIDIDYLNFTNASIDSAFIDFAQITNLSAINSTTGNLTVTGLLSIDPAQGSLDFGNFSVDGLGNLTATNATISGDITATSGSFTGSVQADSGNIAGWLIQQNKLASAPVNNARIELDDALSRISIIDSSNNTKVAMGYLENLPKNSGVGNWGISDYGFWVRNGDRLVIDGDAEYINGDWFIQNDASYLVQDGATGNDIIRLGSSGPDKGLFFYSGAATNVELGRITGNTIRLGQASGSGKLEFNATTGKLSVTGDAEFSGDLIAATGSLGDLSLEGALTLGTNGSINLNNKFKVNNQGELEAVDATIEGAVTTNQLTATGGILGALEVNGAMTVSGSISSTNTSGWTLGSAGYINKQSGAQSGFFFNKIIGTLASFDGLYINDDCYFGGEYQDVQSMFPAINVISGDKEFIFKEVQDIYKIKGFEIVDSTISNGSITNADITTNQAVLVTNVNATDASEYGFNSCWVKGTIRGQYESADGTAGVTANVTNPTSISIKNGLIVSIS